MKAININNVVGYKPIPKTACTSIKRALYKIVEKKQFDFKLNGGKTVHNYWEERYQSIENCGFKFIMVRDPIKRLLSAYSNRVGHHREIDFERLNRVNPSIIGGIEIYNPGLGQFIDHFESYLQIETINHHCKPLSDWVDGDLSMFDKVYRLEDIKNLQTDLSQLLEQTIMFPREQTGGRKIGIAELSKSQVEFLLDYYRNDYILLGEYYSIDEFWKAWKSGI